MMENLDHIFKADAKFPSPEDGRILAVDGLGFRWHSASEVLPAAVFSKIPQFFRPVGSATFMVGPLMADELEAIAYELCGGLSLRRSVNPLFQEVVRSDGSVAFKVLYERDYRRVTIDATDLAAQLVSAGLPKPTEGVSDPEGYHQTFARMATAYLGR